MNKVIKKYSYLKDEQYGQIVKMINRYESGEEISESFGNIENIIFFDRYVKKDVDKVLKERNRKRRQKNG